MKNYLNKALIAILLLGAGTQLHAYSYEFANHTTKPIAISLTYKGILEKRRVRVVQPNTQVKFRPGDADITRGKAGFVPSRFAYIVNPSADNVSTEITDNKTRDAQIAKSDSFPWKAFTITWLPSEEYKLAIELADTLGTATELAGKTALKAGAAYMTGGASVAAEGAAGIAQQAMDKAKADAMKTAADANFGLGKIFSSIGKTAARDLVGDHHFDIVEVQDDKGNTKELKFISML